MSSERFGAAGATANPGLESPASPRLQACNQVARLARDLRQLHLVHPVDAGAKRVADRLGPLSRHVPGAEDEADDRADRRAIAVGVESASDRPADVRISYTFRSPPD